MIYRRDGLIFMSIKDTYTGYLKVAKILPTETSWGVFEPAIALIEPLIPEASPESLDRLLRGDPTPFRNTKGLREPQGCLKLIDTDRSCDEQDTCLSYNKTHCTLGHRKMPDCFSPVAGDQIRPLILAWKEGFFIVRERT